jgi:DNA topoisomerase-3
VGIHQGPQPARPQDKRTIVADDKLRAVFGKDSAGMFELAGILGNHLSGE